MVAGQALNLEMEVRFLPPQPLIFRKEGVLETSSATSVATILGNVSSIKTVVGDVWDVMTANPILCVFICVSLLSVGFAVFRKAKRAARG